MALDVASGDADDRKKGKNNTVNVDLETMRLKLSTWASRWSRRITLDTLRPLPVFLGIEPNMCLSMGAFTPPAQKVQGAPEKVKSRLSLNLAYFVTNYALLTTIIAITVALMHPGMVVFVGVVWGLWTLHAFLIRNQVMLFGRVAVHDFLTVQQRFYLLSVITAWVVVWKCLKPTLIVVAISGSFIVTHAFLRDPKHIEASHARKNGSSGNNSDEEEEEFRNYASSGGNSVGSEVLVERPMARTVV